MKIYLVICYWGEYDDYTEVPDKSFKTREKAEKYIESKDQKNVQYKIEEVELEE